MVSILQNLKNGGSNVHQNAATGLKAVETGDLILSQDYRNFDKIMIISAEDALNATDSHIWEKRELEYMFNHTYRFNIAKGVFTWWVWSSVKLGTANHPLSTPTCWKLEDEKTKIVDVIGINY